MNGTEFATVTVYSPDGESHVIVEAKIEWYASNGVYMDANGTGDDPYFDWEYEIQSICDEDGHLCVAPAWYKDAMAEPELQSLVDEIEPF